jgi:hypothetical protein
MVFVATRRRGIG